ncbi:MAG: DNA primase [Candidatus Thermoplasmatota archaeon]|nr:DNA primase [Candidatus Thermoplasmatota archaeon]
MAVDPNTTKYQIRAQLEAEGVVEKPDVIGAVFGQTEGLLGEELDLRDLQKNGRIGRIEVNVVSKKGKTDGSILIPSSLDQVETSILAAGLETIDRIGPCRATVSVEGVDDVRITKRTQVVDRAKEILSEMLAGSKATSIDLKEEVRQAVQVADIVSFGPDKLPAGPNVEDTDAIIVVEGRSDVLNLLKVGIKNSIAAEGTHIPAAIGNLSKEKVVTAFVDGDRGGDLILKELLQVAEVDFVAKAPRGLEVEELTQKQIMKALRNKMPTEQFVDMFGLGPRQEPRRARSAPKRARPAKEARVTAAPAEKAPRKKAPLEKVSFRKVPPKKVRAPEPEVSVPEDLQEYQEILQSLRGTTKAQIIKGGKTKPKEVAVRDLVNLMKKEGKGVKVLVFDGIITQRILDIASDNGMEMVIGVKEGSIEQRPEGVRVYTADDLAVK